MGIKYKDTVGLSVQVSRAEFAILRRRAAEEMVSVSNYVRDCINARLRNPDPDARHLQLRRPGRARQAGSDRG